LLLLLLFSVLLLPLLSAWQLAVLQLEVDRRRWRHVTTASLLWLLLPLQAANAVHALLLALLLLLLLTALLLLLQPDRALVNPSLLGRPAELLHAGLTRSRRCCSSA
jgi:hypothetical protein